MISKVQLKVRGYHLDIFQHVNNARYLEFLEEGRWDFFEQTGIAADMMSQGAAWGIVNININFRKEANFGDVLEVQTVFSKLGNRSITMQQRIVNVRTKKVVVDAEVISVCFSRKEKAAIELPDAYRKKVEQMIMPLDELVTQ